MTGARYSAPDGSGEEKTIAPATDWRQSLPYILLLTLIWRVPSLFDPPWVNDEGTYFAVAQAMRHGYRLYVDVWENKPPAIYLLYGEVYHLLGPPLIAARLITSMMVLTIVALVWAVTRSFAQGKVNAAGAAALGTGLLLGVPVLEGTTANAEVFLAACTVFGIWLLAAPLVGGGGQDTARGAHWKRAGIAGVALALAVMFKAVAGFDAIAIGLWLVLHRRREVLPFAAGFAASLAGLLVLCDRAGILSAMLRDAVLYDMGYVGHGNGGGVPWLVLVKLAVLVLGTVFLRRAPFPYLWLLYAAAGALISGRFFGHYALQAVAPLCLSTAIFLQPRVRLERLTGLLPALFLAAGLLAAGVGWGLAASGHDSILARRLQYYVNFTRYALQREDAAAYRAQIDEHVNRNLSVVDSIRALPPGRLLVWGNTPWIYPLSRRLPATPYTSSLRSPEVPGETDTLRRAVETHGPEIVVVIKPAMPNLGARGRHSLRELYRLVGHAGNAAIYLRDS